MKALRTTDPGIGWQSIEVLGRHGGGHSITLTGAAAELAAVRDVRGLSVSLSARGRQATAIVIAQAGR